MIQNKSGRLRGLAAMAARIVVFAVVLACGVVLPAGKTGAAGAWTVVPSPNAAIFGGDLFAVSCPSASACVAVGRFDNGSAGQPLVESWNGSAWNIVPSPSTSPTQYSELDGVSCTSANACVAVGYWSNGTEYQTLTESWNGTSWTIIPSPNSSPSQTNELSAVSCVSASACVAVGFYENAGSDYQTLVESWNGSTWSIVPSPNPTFFNYLDGVSCTSAMACVAVGAATGPSSALPLVESWDGVAWSAVPSPGSGVLQSVSCSSTVACLAVGVVSGATLVQSWNGTTWTVVSSPSLPGYSRFSGVSCLSATACTAVGYDGTASGTQTVVESWNGSGLTVVPSPNPSSGLNGLFAVSCAAANFCAAVGDWQSPVAGTSSNGGPEQTLVESWDGSAWSITPSPDAPVTQSGFNALNAVSCSADGSCTAVGDFGNSSDVYTLVERWNGSGWSIVASPSVSNGGPGSATNYLSGVSCTSANACAAVGHAIIYLNKGQSETLALVGTWYGTAWTIASSVSGALGSVSCPSANVCFAVGSSGGGAKQTLVMSWFGGSWNQVSSPNASANDSLSGVSCVNATACTAVGQNSGQTLIETWDGSVWSIVPSPNASANDSLDAVSCVSAGACMAVGQSNGQTLAESWNGSVWTVVPSPNTSASDGLAGVSCTTASACVAAGQSSGQTLVESWDGTSWSVVSSADPSGNGILAGVSCAGAGLCMGVGTYVNGSGIAETLVEQGSSGPPPAPGPLAISKTHSGSFSQGQTNAAYTLTVSNPSGSRATSGTVTVVDSAPSGLTVSAMSGAGWACVLLSCTRADSLAGGHAYPAITVIANVANNAPTGANVLVNRASVSGGGDPTAPHSTSDPTTIGGSGPPQAAASLSIAKSHNGVLGQGQTGAAYTINVSNAAAAGATTGTVTATEAAPAGLTITAMSGAGWSCMVPSCRRSDALAGGNGYPAITVTANVADDAPTGAVAFTNRASVSGGGDPSGPHTADDPTTVTGSSGPAPASTLSIQSTHGGSFAQGQTGATYTVTVANTLGAGATSGLITVIDSAPPGLTVTSMAGTGWSCPGPMRCTRSDSLSPGQSYEVITVTVSVAATAPTGMNAVTNHASVTGGGDPTGPHTAADPTTIVP
jgi:uncharacterized repeat protein (TIGR01451 family)